MSNNTINLTAQDQTTIRTAAHGAVALISFADVARSAHKAATHGSYALQTATGAVGHVLAPKPRDIKLNYKSAAALADQVLPALTASVALLEKADAAEAANFREIVTAAVDAASNAGRGEPGPAVAVMVAKIAAALNAA